MMMNARFSQLKPGSAAKLGLAARQGVSASRSGSTERSGRSKLRHARPAARSTDTESLLLRLAIGPMLVAHGWNKVFGKGGMAGTTRWFDSLGLKPAKVHARLAAATEIGAGSALALGAASPLPSAAIIGLMTTAARTDHRGKGFFVFKGGWEYTGVIAAVAAVIAALGPGRYSVDGLRGRQRRGIGWALAAAAFGVASSTLLIATSYRPQQSPEGAAPGTGGDGGAAGPDSEAAGPGSGAAGAASGAAGPASEAAGPASGAAGAATSNGSAAEASTATAPMPADVQSG
jgi:putative oxidoreductase